MFTKFFNYENFMIYGSYFSPQRVECLFQISQSKSTIHVSTVIIKLGSKVTKNLAGNASQVKRISISIASK